MSFKVGEIVPPLDRILERNGGESEDRRALLSAISSRNLSNVQRAFARWQSKDPRTRIRIELFGTGLAQAIEIGHISIVTYLLSRGVPFNLDQVQMAIWTKSQPILDLLLDYGWEINQPIDEKNPPFLRYVAGTIMPLERQYI